MVVIVRDICIVYDLEHNSKIEDIKTIINNNYNLFLDLMGSSSILSLIPIDDDNVLYVENFEETFFDIADKSFNNDSVKKSIQNSEAIIALYIESLIRQCPENSNALIQPNKAITDEMLYSLIAYKYFYENGTFDGFVEYLKYRENTDKILCWLRNEFRYDVYNYLLGITVNHLKENDFEFLENISSIIVKILNQMLSNIIDNKNEKIDKLTSISLEELDNLFYEFLHYINAPNNWKQLYEELKQDKKIYFEKRIDDIDYSKCYIDDNGVLKIIISFDGTIDSFCSLVHEFVHYLSLHNKASLPRLSLLEFPSIFFERIASEFLKNKGYSSDIIDNVINERKQNNTEIYLELSSLFSDIASFINCGVISKTDKVKYWENNFKIIQEAKENAFRELEENGMTMTQDDLDFLKPYDVDVDNGVDDECDILIESFINNGILIIDGYQYLLDTFLVDELLKRLTIDPSIISKMVEITDKLGIYSLNDILIYFEMPYIFENTSSSNDLKVRKLHL